MTFGIPTVFLGHLVFQTVISYSFEWYAYNLRDSIHPIPPVLPVPTQKLPILSLLIRGLSLLVLCFPDAGLIRHRLLHAVNLIIHSSEQASREFICSLYLLYVGTAVLSGADISNSGSILLHLVNSTRDTSERIVSWHFESGFIVD